MTARRGGRSSLTKTGKIRTNAVTGRRWQLTLYYARQSLVFYEPSTGKRVERRVKRPRFDAASL